MRDRRTVRGNEGLKPYQLLAIGAPIASKDEGEGAPSCSGDQTDPSFSPKLQ